MVKLSFALCLLVLSWLSSGCTSVAQQPNSEPSNRAQQVGSEEPQWVQFGVVLEVQPIQLTPADSGEKGMRLEIILDNGNSLVVEQPLSQAGELRVGDRVRVLKIGGYSRVTFWPYHNE